MLLKNIDQRETKTQMKWESVSLLKYSQLSNNAVFVANCLLTVLGL